MGTTSNINRVILICFIIYMLHNSNTTVNSIMYNNNYISLTLLLKSLIILLYNYNNEANLVNIIVNFLTIK
jgi:hypothetical protein